MKRYGPLFNGTVGTRPPGSPPLIPPVNAPPGLSDKAVGVISVTGWDPAPEPVALHVQVAPYDPNVTWKVKMIHFVCLAVGAPLPADPGVLLASGLPQGSVDVSADVGGKTYTLTIADTSKVVGPAGGVASFQAIIEDEAPDPTALPAPLPVPVPAPLPVPIPVQVPIPGTSPTPSPTPTFQAVPGPPK